MGCCCTARYRTLLGALDKAIKKGNHFEDIYGTGIPLFIIPAALVLVTGIFSMNFMLIIFSVLDIVCEYCSAYGVRKCLHPAKTEESSDEAETKENEDGE